MMIDMPKLISPFVRDPVTHRITNQITEGYEWVFNDPNIQVVEKIDGTNVSVYVEKGELVAVRNRTTPINCSPLVRSRFMDGLRNTYEKGWFPVSTGQHFGEMMGPGIQRNFLDLKEPLWYPFEYLKKAASYRTWSRIEHTYDAIADWFRRDLFSLLWKQRGGVTKPPEGVVFYHPDGRMAKLRMDMMPWWTGTTHKESNQEEPAGSG